MWKRAVRQQSLAEATTCEGNCNCLLKPMRPARNTSEAGCQRALNARRLCNKMIGKMCGNTQAEHVGETFRFACVFWHDSTVGSFLLSAATHILVSGRSLMETNFKIGKTRFQHHHESLKVSQTLTTGLAYSKPCWPSKECLKLSTPAETHCSTSNADRWVSCSRMVNHSLMWSPW